MALFAAPVLLDAAYDTSVRDLWDNWAPVSGLVLVAVGLTIAAVAVTARAMEPGMAWVAAIALGGIVAPPDAAAATAVLRQVRLPHRLVVILEGESLLNDASASKLRVRADGKRVPGPRDNRYWELALTADATVILSSNDDLLMLDPRRGMSRSAPGKRQ